MPKRKGSPKPNQNLPAHETKHLMHLDYTFKQLTFTLAQNNDGATNGTALWLGAQVLTAWLSEHYGKKSRAKRIADRRPRMIELGSGIGLTALAMCSLGWDVIATDLPDVINSVLSRNVAHNLPNLPAGCGTINVRALDWNVLPEDWVWDNGRAIALPTRTPANIMQNTTQLAPPFDLIVTADTVYLLSLVEPLLRTVTHLCDASKVEVSSRQQWPPIYVAVERRDPIVLDKFLQDAKRAFVVEQIPNRAITHAMAKSGLSWDKEDWHGLEVWSLMMRKSKMGDAEEHSI